MEVLGLLQAQFMLKGSWFWDKVAFVNENFEYVGYSIIGFFATSCLVAAVAYRCCLVDGNDRGEPTAQFSIQSPCHKVVAKQSLARSSSSMDDYLRRRMLGLAHGSNVGAVGGGGVADKDGRAWVEAAAGRTIVAAQLKKSGTDDYLRRRMLALARGSSVQAMEI